MKLQVMLPRCNGSLWKMTWSVPHIEQLSGSCYDFQPKEQLDEGNVDVEAEEDAPDEAESEGRKVVFEKTNGINGWERVESDEAGEDSKVELGDVEE